MAAFVKRETTQARLQKVDTWHAWQRRLLGMGRAGGWMVVIYPLNPCSITRQVEVDCCIRIFKIILYRHFA